MGKTPERAEASHRVPLVPETGPLRKGDLDVAGPRTVLALCGDFGKPKKQLTDPMNYYDPSYYRKALAR